MSFETVLQRAPDLDFLSFQAYGALALLPKLAEGILADSPFMITEWGPLRTLGSGRYRVGRTD